MSPTVSGLGSHSLGLKTESVVVFAQGVGAHRPDTISAIRTDGVWPQQAA